MQMNLKNLKLGDKVKIQHYLVRAKDVLYKEVNYPEMFEFCKRHNIIYRGDSICYGGYFFNTRLRIKSFKEPVNGIIVGKRNIDLDGIFDYDDGWSFGRQFPVYLVAVSMKQICRVPEEYIEIGDDIQ